MYRRKYSDEFRSNVLTSIQCGLSNRQAAKLHRMPASTLGTWRARAHIRSREWPIEPRSLALRAQAIERFNSGEAARVIARDLAVSCFTIYNWFKKYIREHRA